MKNFTTSFISIFELEKLLDSNIVKDSSKTLIQIFCAHADVTNIKIIQQFFKYKYPNSTIIGSTTDGIIEGSSVYFDTKSVVTFTSFEDTELKSVLLKHDDYQYNSFNIGEAIVKKICNDDSKVLISFADGINTNGEEYVNGISAINPKLILSGGLAADNGNLVKTYVFDRDEISSCGAVGVSLTSKTLHVATNYTFDWIPIGKKLRITKAIKNRIYEIDGLPVVDIYEKYMGKEVADKLPKVGIEYPLIFEKDGISIGRAVLHKHSDGSLTFAGNIQEGELVRFGVGNIEMILRNSYYHIENLIEKLEYETEAIFIYSCMARRRFMNKYTEDELSIIKSLGQVSGFFTYGEFFHSKNGNQLLNETMTVLTLSESNRPNLISTKKTETKQNFGVNPEHVIAHLANVVSNELAELNENLENRVQESSDYIYKQAYFNPLTGLPNRLSLITKLEESIGQIIFLINIDDFTMINDFYGHDTGDKVLERLALILESLVEDDPAQVYNLPSDEFAIIMDIEHSKQKIESKIKYFISEIENEDFLFNGHLAHVTVTISAALINEGKTGLINADMSLKLAKKANKDYMIFDEDLNLARQYENNINIANIIKNAILMNEIIPYFQPIFDAKSGKVEKYESLVRLKKTDGEILGPYAFLGISQKIKLYSQITEIMIEKSFSFFAKNGMNFSINLSFSDIANIKTREFIFSKILEYDIAKQLTIEILETQELDDEDSIFKFIESVYSYGSKIAIDDFGSGYANFRHMTVMRSDYMKIDGSLIKNIDTDKNAKLIVETIIVFAKKLNKKTVAEFVHSQAVYEVVKALDIDYIQGYYLGEPLPTLIE